MNETNAAPKMYRQHYAKAFRQQAVELWQASGKTGAQMAEELGIPVKRLYSWRASLQLLTGAAAPVASAPEALARENAALRQEVAQLRQQRDILKKTLGILSEPPSNATTGLKP
jgi:transposase